MHTQKIGSFVAIRCARGRSLAEKMTSGQCEETDHADEGDRQTTGHLCSGIAQVGLAVAEFSVIVFHVKLSNLEIRYSLKIKLDILCTPKSKTAVV